MTAECRGGARDKIGVAYGGGVDGDLVGARRHHGAHAGEVAESAAHGVGDGEFGGGVGSHVDSRDTVVARGGDVEENHLVGTLTVVGGGELDGIAGVA